MHAAATRGEGRPLARSAKERSRVAPSLVDLDDNVLRSSSYEGGELEVATEESDL